MTIEPWRIERSEYVVSDQRMRLRSDQCRRSDGAAVGPCYVIEHPMDAVNVFALTARQEVILINEYHHAAGIVGLGLPAGGMEAGEPPEAAVRRELLEETGYVPAEVHLLGSTFMNWRVQTNRVHHFLALDCVLAGPQNLDENEEIEIVLTSLERFEPGMLQQSFHLANALLATMHLQAGISA